MKNILILLPCLLFVKFIDASSPLLSGPMQGYLEMRESVIWLQTKDASRVYALFDDLGTPQNENRQTNIVNTTEYNGNTAKLYFTELEPGHTYSYRLFIDDIEVERPYDFEFTTPQPWHQLDKMPEVRLALASCFYVNDSSSDRPGNAYGGDYQILEEIVKKKPTAMLWLGDFAYLRPTDWWSRSGYIYRYTQSRSLPEIQPLLAVCPHFGIWDDHEYGPNDANGSWVMKETALEVFKLFWTNHSYGFDDVPGIMSGFQLEDISVIITDNRYHRSEQMKNGEEQILGEAQIERIINLLKYSRSPFKLVAVGGQVLNSARVYENHANYEAERQKLIDRIVEEEIKGVIILSGDRHHSEAMVYEGANGLKIWEFTTSPLTSGPNTNVTETNDYRIDGSLIQERNFSVIKVSGDRGERVLEIAYFSSSGESLYQYQIKQSETR